MLPTDSAASRTRFFAMAMGCPCFIVAVISFIFVILNGTTAFFILGVLLLILSAAGLPGAAMRSTVPRRATKTSRRPPRRRLASDAIHHLLRPRVFLRGPV